MTRDVFDTFATHSGLVYDVTDTVLNKKGHCRVLATFKTSIKKKKQDEESSEKLLFVFRKSISIKKARDVSSVRFSINWFSSWLVYSSIIL